MQANTSLLALAQSMSYEPTVQDNAAAMATHGYRIGCAAAKHRDNGLTVPEITQAMIEQGYETYYEEKLTNSFVSQKLKRYDDARG